MSIRQFTDYFQQYPALKTAADISLVLLSALAVYIITRSILLKWISRLVKRTKTTIDDSLFEHGAFQRLALFAPVVIIYNFAYLFGGSEDFIRRILSAVIVIISLFTIDAFLSVLTDLIDVKTRDKRFQVKTYFQIGKIILYAAGLVVMIAALIGKSPLVLLSGIGALTAVLLLVFRDTILSFVASLQISSYDLVKVGDWIEMPKYGVDGDVIDIALHTVKIQNWDKTITVIPTHKLIEESFKNWQGMTQSGGRRIKRAINIDMASVRFCDEEMLDRFETISLLTDYIRERRVEIEESNTQRKIDVSDVASGRRMTNLGVFRAYLQEYLKSHPKIHPDMTFLIRQLEPAPQGLPVELYVFTNDTDWVNYEAIQADIFDHIVAAVSLFDLAIFQQPSGTDIGKLNAR